LISRIENEQFSKKESVRVAELFDDVLDEINHRLSEREISLEINLSKQLMLVNINRDLLFQLVYNLMNNAIRYNKANGSIRIWDQIHPDGSYEVGISDTGIGIPEDELATIFNRFKKANQSEESAGYGLGLSIVKSIADYHQIKIGIISEVSVGTTFTIVFPEDLVRMENSEDTQ
jgi:signal transduction histidine kinase